MTQHELQALKAKVDADDPAAMFLYAEAVRATNPAEYEKYIVLAAQLGEPHAAELLGDKYHELGDMERAMQFYKTGAKGGLLDCSVKLALVRLDFDEYAATRELEELAESGVKSACAALAAYYKSKGNRKEYNFWRSLLK